MAAGQTLVMLTGRRRPLGGDDGDRRRVHRLALRDARALPRRSSSRSASASPSALVNGIGVGDLPRERADHDPRHLGDHARPPHRRGAEAVHRRSCRTSSSRSARDRFLTYMPYDLLVWVPVSALIILGLRYSGIGRMIYAVGDNPVACAARRRARVAGAARRVRRSAGCSRRPPGSCSSASTTPPTSASPRRSCCRPSRRS